MLHSRYPSGRKHTQVCDCPHPESPKKAQPAPHERALGGPWAVDISRRTFLTWMGVTAALLTGGVPHVRASEPRAAKVGFVLPEEGPLAGEARSLAAGFELFVREKGREAPLEIVKKDPGPSEENTLEVLASLLMNKEVQFLIGPLSLGAAEKAVHAVAGTEVIFFVCNPSVRLVPGEMCLSQSFRLCGSTYQYGQPLAPWAVKNIGLKAFITGTDDWMGNEQADFFALGIEKGGGLFADRIMVPEGAAGGLREVIEAVRATNPDFLFASFRDKHAQAFLKAFRKASPGLRQPIIGPNSLVEFPQQLSGDTRNAVGLRTLTTIRDPKALTDLIREKLDKRISHVSRAAEGYDIAQIICRAVLNLQAETSDLSRLIKVIEDMEVEGFRGKVRFDKNHEAILNMMVQEWELRGRTLYPKIVDDLGPISSPDFGCGRVGFPKRPDADSREPEQAGDDSE